MKLELTQQLWHLSVGWSCKDDRKKQKRNWLSLQFLDLGSAFSSIGLVVGWSELMGQCHEINFTRLFSSTTSFWSYKRYSMRILNFAEFSRCYSTMKEPRRIMLHRQVWTPWCTVDFNGEPDQQCALHRGVTKNFLTDTRRFRLHGGVWTLRCRLHRWVIIPTFKACQCSLRDNSSKITLWMLSIG